MKYRSITVRWIVNTVCVITVILLIIAVSAIVSVRSYYYSTVSMTLDSMDNELVASYFNLNSGTTKDSFASAAREFIADFGDKDKMEVWVIGSDGNVILSSSGFSVGKDSEMPDYTAAVSSGSGRGDWTGKLTSGEKVMAMTTLFNIPGSQRSVGTRYMISLENVDRQIGLIAGAIIIGCAIAVSLVLMSGMLFTRSIIRPVRSIGETARQIAGGDFEARIPQYKYNDEIGELCDTINYMAKEINAADRMKNDFISTISHELRTPLTAIKGWGETLSHVEETDPALLNRGLNVIISESIRLTGIVEDLLDFSRMQSGKLNMRTEKIDVLAELDETIFTFKERSAREGIEIIYNAPTEPAPMLADPDRIKQVFVNVLDNALKYTEQGGKITIFAELLPSALLVKISDTGCGISPEDLPRVKEKFYKSNTSVRGSGIGLAVADEIIKYHKGELAIDSTQGVGTTVLISLPILPSTTTQTTEKEKEEA